MGKKCYKMFALYIPSLCLYLLYLAFVVDLNCQNRLCAWDLSAGPLDDRC